MVGRSITHKIKHSHNSFVSMMIPQMTKLVLLFIAWGSLLYLSSGIPNEFSITGFDPEEFSSNHNSFVLFQKWSDKYGKIYETLEELEKRFQVFKRNLNFITQHNSQRSGTSYQLGLNEFADLSHEEFKKIYLTVVPPPNTTHVPLKNQYCPNRPPSFDWRDFGVVTPVKNQGPCGSCWAFSAVGAMESLNAIMRGPGSLIRLSEQALLDCDRVSLGCDGGWAVTAFSWVISNGGIDSEDDYPYRGEQGPCQTRERVVSITGYQEVPRNEDDILCFLLQQPLSAFVDSSNFQHYAGGILDASSCSSDPNKVNHVVLIVGYGTENGQDYWIVKNSWGPTWGINGYFKVRRNAGVANGICAINSYVSFPSIDWGGQVLDN